MDCGTGANSSTNSSHRMNNNAATAPATAASAAPARAGCPWASGTAARPVQITASRARLRTRCAHPSGRPEPAPKHAAARHRAAADDCRDADRKHYGQGGSGGQDRLGQRPCTSHSGCSQYRDGEEANGNDSFGSAEHRRGRRHQALWHQRGFAEPLPEGAVRPAIAQLDAGRHGEDTASEAEHGHREVTHRAPFQPQGSWRPQAFRQRNPVPAARTAVRRCRCAPSAHRGRPASATSPSASTTMLSASRTVFSRCEISIVVRPSRCARRLL